MCINSQSCYLYIFVIFALPHVFRIFKLGIILSKIIYRICRLHFISIEEYSSLVCLVQNILLFCCYFTWLLIACDVWLTSKGICERNKALRPADGSERRYSAGQKGCAMCELFIKWEGGTVVSMLLQ